MYNREIEIKNSDIEYVYIHKTYVAAGSIQVPGVYLILIGSFNNIKVFYTNVSNNNDSKRKICYVYEKTAKKKNENLIN